MLLFRYVGRTATRAVRRPELPEETRAMEVRRIRWAILSCARRVPWRAMRFQQGLAAKLMLQRRGIPSVLYYRAAGL
jgi:Transglutaminase-like superfamily